MQVTELEMFGKAVTSSMTSSSIETDHGMKRRKIEKDDPKPTHLQSVQSYHHLVRLLRVYFSGKKRITGIQPVGVEPRGVDDWDEPDVPTVPRLTEYLDATTQFSEQEYADVAEKRRMYSIQASISSYVGRSVDGKTTFNPHKTLTETVGLLRCFQCGPSGYLSSGAEELMSYLLPLENPSVDEVRDKLERVLNATGRSCDLSKLDMKDLVGEDHFDDPHNYSAITIDERDLVGDHVGMSAYEAIIRANYHILTTLKERTTCLFQKLCDQDNAIDLRRLQTRLAKNIKIMLNGDSTEGVPKVYGRLYKESIRLMKSMTTVSDDKIMKRARAIFYGKKRDHEFTGLSWMFIKDACNAATCLNFMVQQQTVYMMLYNMHFSVTLNTNEASSFIVLAGPSETGKSWAMKKITSGIADSLSRTEDSQSEHAGTIDDSGDLQVVIEDEFKNTNDGKDASSDSRIKNKQSQMSNGVTIRKRYHRSQKTDKPVVEVGVGIERSYLWTGTNNPQCIPPALLNRAIVIPVVQANSRSHREKVGGVATAIHNNLKVQRNFRACQVAHRTLSALQVHYTALESIGGIPKINEDLFELFKLIHVKRFGGDASKNGETESSRQTVEHLRLATSIHIRDHLSIWYCRGLGEHFQFDKSIEGLWYAWSSYLRMEEIVLAMIQIEGTRSMSGFIREVMVLLKESIMQSDGQMMSAGNYWVTKYTRRSGLIRDAKQRLVRFGAGLCEKVIEMCEQTKTGGLPNVKFELVLDRNCEHLMVHKQWTAQITSPVEASIIQVLKRLSKDVAMCHREYESEKMFVFETQIRKSLKNPNSDNAIQHTELKSYSADAIAHGYQQLENRRYDGIPAIQTPPEAKIAVFSDACRDGCEPTEDGRWKHQRKMFVPMVVHHELLTSSETKPESPIDIFLKDMLLIAGGYVGRRVFSGMDPADPKSAVTDNCFYLKPSDKTVQEIHNPHRLSKATKNIIYGDDFDDSDDEDCHQSLFPPDKEVLTFTENSFAERSVAELAHARVPLESRVRDVFERAYVEYR